MLCNFGLFHSSPWRFCTHQEPFFIRDIFSSVLLKKQTNEQTNKQTNNQYPYTCYAESRVTKVCRKEIFIRSFWFSVYQSLNNFWSGKCAKKLFTNKTELRIFFKYKRFDNLARSLKHLHSLSYGRFKIYMIRLL